MKKAAIIAIIVAFVLMFAGTAMIIGSLSTEGFNLDIINKRMNETQTINIDGFFSSIEVPDTVIDVEVLPSEDSTCRVEYSVIERIDITAEVSDGILKLTINDNRKWLDNIGFIWHNDPHVILYLPSAAYEKLTVNGKSGDISVADDLTFASVEIKTMSGDVNCYANVTESLYIKSISGDINSRDVETADVELYSTSGDISLRNASIVSLKVDSTSGDIVLNTVTADDEISLTAVSGDVEFSQIDAPSLRFKSISGDIEGTLNSSKRFITNTTSGEVRVPNSDTSDELCEASTVSGDISVSILNK